MNVEVINVGTELLLGEIINTEAPVLFKMCKELGFDIYHQTTVGDNPQRLLECLDIAFKRGADCVITTAGLGPTQDDLTKELSAEYLGLELVYNEEEARKVDEKCRFVTGLDVVSDNNFKQAYFPENAYILENDVGTANGCVMSKDGKMIINLPGPPKEFNYVLEHSLKPYLEQYRQEQIFTLDYLVMGIGESMIDEKLTETQYKQTDVTLAMYAGEGYVRVRIATKAKTKEEAYQHMTPMRKEIETLLKGYLIPGGSIEKALKDIMVPIQFIGDIDVPTWFKPYVKKDADLVIYSKVEHVSLGDQVTIHVNNDKGFTDGMLKDYHLSMNRLTSKLQLYLYRYLKNSLPLQWINCLNRFYDMKKDVMKIRNINKHISTL